MNREGLIAEYLFKDNANDTCGNHHSVVHGATRTGDRFANPNAAYHFDGTDDYISIDPPPALNNDAFSLSVWVRCEAREWRGWTNCIIAQDDGNDEDQSHRVFQLSAHDGRIVWHRMVGARDPIVRRPIPLGRWLHLAAVYENGVHRIYCDAKLHDSTQHRFWTHPTQPIHIGRKGTGEPHFFFLGDIDDIRLYNRALQEDEIRDLCHEGGWTPPAPPPIDATVDPISGKWGRNGRMLLDLNFDGVSKVTGLITARDPGNLAPILEGTFNRSTGWLKLEGTARHPDDGTEVLYLIEGALSEGELTLTATFRMTASGQYNSDNGVLTREGAHS